jgi:EpsI family protein
MSATDLTTPPPSPSSPPSQARPASPARQGSVAATWLRVVVVCSILGGSASLRAWQTERIEAGLEAGRKGPRLDLATVPITLGPWKGRDTAIDPMIARATGADQIVTRRYVNQETGTTIDVILLYGPAVSVYLHAPEVCYPTVGYAQVAGPEIRTIKTGSTSAPFKALVYSKGEGGPGELQEVYYSWWYLGHWSPDIGVQKYTERIPSMYKVHLARRMTAGEKRDVGNPCESFLHELLPEMERRLATTQPPQT